MKDHSLAETAYQAIKKDLLTCSLDPGSQISQSQLVERYDFGITPVREALKRLEQEGFVRSIPRFGFVISPITLRDVEELYDLRLLLEEAAVRTAIQRASDTQLAQIQTSANFSYTFKDRDSYLGFLEANIRFHGAIALAAGNLKLADMLSSVLHQMTRIFNLGLDLRDSAEEMRHEHTALAAALAARDVEQAVKINADQIAHSRQRVLEEFILRIDPRAASPLAVR